MEHPHSVHSGHTSFKKKARNGANGGDVEAWIAVRVTFLPNKLPPRKPLLISVGDFKSPFNYSCFFTSCNMLLKLLQNMK